MVISWTNTSAALESALSVTGAWNQVTGAPNPYPVAPTNVASFYRLRGQGAVSFGFRYVAPTYTTLVGDPLSGCGCTSPENPNSSSAPGNPQDNGLGSVFLHTGELVQHAIDLAIPGRGFDWRLERAYRSGMNYDGPAGHGWEFNYNRRLFIDTNGNVLRMDGLGRADRYLLVSGVYQSPSGFYTRLTRNLDGTFVERDRHGNESDYSATNSLGVAQLSRMADRNSNQMTFQYNGASQLTNVVDTLGRSIAYQYDNSGRLVHVVDFIGRTVTFSYDANGNLVSATGPAVTGTPNGNDFPSGKTTVYAYSSGYGDPRFNHQLLTVTAPNEAAVSGPPRLAAQFDTDSASTNAGRLVSLFLGGTNASGVGAGGTLGFNFLPLAQVLPGDVSTAVFQATGTNRNGNVTQYQFNQLGNVLSKAQFTSGLRAGDPPGYTNTFTYNADGEMLTHTNGEADSVQYTYDSSNPDRFQQGNVLQVSRSPGPRGGDQPQISHGHDI